MRVYIDTSVIGGCYDKEFRGASRHLFKEFSEGIKTAVISDITIQELEGAPQFVREFLDQMSEECKEIVFVDDETLKLANAYVNEQAIGALFFNDALHIALATIKKVDVLVSWNFKHIVNINRIRLYNSVNLKYGYALVEIRSPREVLNEE